MKRRITHENVEAVRPGATDLFLWDTEIRGFGCKVTPRGRRVYVLQWSRAGKIRRATIGPHPDVKAAAARAMAVVMRGAIAAGKDPETVRHRRGPAADTLRAIGADYIARHAKEHAPRSWRETERILERDLCPALGDRVMSSIRKGDVVAVLDRLSGAAAPPAPPAGARPGGEAAPDAGAPMSARNAFRVARQVFRWALQRDLIPHNPIAGLISPVRDTRRERVLSDDELRALWKAWAEPSPYNAAAKVMLLTGQRVQEVARMRRGELAADRTWVIPSERYKTHIPHVVPLSKPVLAIIAAQPAVEGSDLVFTLSGKPLNGWSNAKEIFDRESGVTGWQLRDLRRTARTLMTRHGVDYFVAERVIGHVIGGVGGIYDRYGYLAEKRAALDTLAKAVAAIVRPRRGRAQRSR